MPNNKFHEEQTRIVEAHMETDSKPIRFGVLAAEIVRKLHERHTSRANNHSQTLQVFRTLQEPANNPPKRKERLTHAPSRTVKIRMIGSVR